MKVFIVTVQDSDNQSRVMAVFHSQRDAEDSLPVLQAANPARSRDLWDIEGFDVHEDALTGPPKRCDSPGGG